MRHCVGRNGVHRACPKEKSGRFIIDWPPASIEDGINEGFQSDQNLFLAFKTNLWKDPAKHRNECDDANQFTLRALEQTIEQTLTGSCVEYSLYDITLYHFLMEGVWTGRLPKG
jgi:hypothetical protein